MKIFVSAVIAALGLTLAACDSAPTPVAAAETISCAAGSIKAQGSSAQTNAINTWIRNYQIACSGATIEYDSVGSGAGRTAFVKGDADFAGTDSPFSAADQPAANASCGTGGGPAIHLPMVVGPIALAYNVAGVGDLRLRPATIAKIFAGRITTWNDPAIVADNPSAVLPSTTIRTVHRLDNSGTTDNFTKFLATTAGADWTYSNNSSWKAPGGSAERGSNGVAAAIAESDGAIGYVEGSYAQFNNLHTALVGNGSNEFVALTDAAAGAAVANAKITGTGADLQLSIDYRTTAAGAYPLVLVTYEVVCARGTPAESLPLVKSFLTYTASEAGQQAVVRLGYAPLPSELRTRVATAVSGLR